MQNREGGYDDTVPTRTVELFVAALFMAVAALVMWESWRLGAGWAPDGPEAGYFPFYVGLVMFVSGTATFVANLVGRGVDRSNFVGRSQLVLVLRVLVPTAVFIVLIGFIGIYVAAALFIGFFMIGLGGYRVLPMLPVALFVPLLLFMMFEVWFLVPLPKGPLEAALGF